MINKICEYRLLVGLLGEKNNAGWWSSSFLAASSKIFLSPICPKTLWLAQYNGVCQAASLMHDEHIGVGLNYHLYRLPDSLERRIAKCLDDEEIRKQVQVSLQTPEVALSRLKELAGKEVDKSEGPLAIGNYSDKGLPLLLKTAISYYADAFKKGYQTFPYMRCS